ncbi:MAG: LexA family transcriptional regulator [Acidobacteria bacterium]|nr:LexA family transcriptional regulator [Acidobacteriota bacterium]
MKNTEYSRRIRSLRERLRLTQHALAELLHVRTPVVASWEQGRREPSARNYRQLAKLAPPKEAWYFLEQIGVTKQLVRSKLPKRPSKQTSSRPIKTRILTANLGKQPFVLVPLLRENWTGASRTITESDIERVLAVPTQFFPDNTGACVGIRNRGDSMAPILQDGFLVFADQTNRDPARLEGRIVAVWGENGPQCRRLETEIHSGQLKLRPENPVYPTLLVDAAATDWLIGAVVFWAGTPGQRSVAGRSQDLQRPGPRSG